MLAPIRIVFADVAAGPVTRHAEAADLNHTIIERGFGVELLLPEPIKDQLLLDLRIVQLLVFFLQPPRQLLIGKAAATDTTQDAAGTKAWNAEIAKLKATPKGGKGQ
jgi:hypothetical protein